MIFRTELKGPEWTTYATFTGTSGNDLGAVLDYAFCGALPTSFRFRSHSIKIENVDAPIEASPLGENVPDQPAHAR
jgi:hypothetical protein